MDIISVNVCRQYDHEYRRVITDKGPECPVCLIGLTEADKWKSMCERLAGSLKKVEFGPVEFCVECGDCCPVCKLPTEHSDDCELGQALAAYHAMRGKGE